MGHDAERGAYAHTDSWISIMTGITLLSEKDPYYEQYEKMDVNYIREVYIPKQSFICSL